MKVIKFRALFRNIANSKTCWQVMQLFRGCSSVDPTKDLHGYTQATPWLQYTGLKDTTDKEIYSGHILNFAHFKVAVEWEEDNSRFAAKYDADTWWPLTKDTIDKANIEIIGNIYENPELLTTAI